jgi:hypothetical protein
MVGPAWIAAHGWSLLAAIAAPAPADLVLTGGAVYTVDAARSWAQAVAIDQGRIVHVGSTASVRAWIGPQTRVVQLGGLMVLPAFQDAHVHPISGGVELGQCNLNGLGTRERIVAKIRECAREQAGAAWLVGGGWDLPAFPGAAPTRDLLDELVPDRPAYLTAMDGHSAWVNSKALELAGVSAATPDPEDGRIERDASGAPAGTLREDAMDLVGRLVPEPTAAERQAGLRRALELLNRHGVAAVQEASAGREALEVYREAERRGELSARVVAALYVSPERGIDQAGDLVRLRQEFLSARLRPIAAKIFADGVIEARTAAMLEPYLDRAGDSGTPIWGPAELHQMVAELAQRDFNVHIHAIGDRAIRMALDAFEAARKDEAARGPRHQIAHLEVIDPADIPRFRTLGVVANFQPLWAYADSYITDLTWPALGPQRSRWIYPIGAVRRAGGLIAFGSDWSVSSLNPLDGIQVAVTRQGLSEPRPAPLLPEQAIDLGEALTAYTIGAAFANGLEQETGSIEIGKSADLVVLSANLFELPSAQIAQTRVLLTLLEGQPVFRDPQLRW